MRIDETRSDVAAGNIDRLAPLVSPDAGDTAVPNRHIGLDDGAGKDVYNPAALQNEVRRFQTPGRPDKIGGIHAPPSWLTIPFRSRRIRFAAAAGSEPNRYV